MPLRPARPGAPQDLSELNWDVSETNQFGGVERRRNPAIAREHREAGEVAVFHELGKALTSSLQLDQVLRTIMEKIDEFLRPDTWSLLLVDEDKHELYFELAVGKNTQMLKDIRIKMGQGIAGWVAENETAVIVPDVSKDTRFFSQVDEKTKMETHSIVAVPVRYRDHCLGVIELINCVGAEGFHERDLALLEALADFAAIALENARHVKRIHELTITDDCTALYNARHHEFHFGDRDLPLAAIWLRIFAGLHRPRPLQGKSTTPTAIWWDRDCWRKSGRCCAGIAG